MYREVPIPKLEHGISIKKIGNVKYVYFNSGYKYDPNKKKTIPLSKSIGKVKENDEEMMYPNDNYEIYFPLEAEGIHGGSIDEDDDATIDVAEDEDKDEGPRYVHDAWVVKVGVYIIICEILDRLHLKEILTKLLGKFYGLFIDIVAYMIITEDNTGWHYRRYAHEHALFSDRMRVYSDSTISRRFEAIEEDVSVAFLDEWNKLQDHNNRIYIAYDSTNKNCQAGEIDMADFGNAKDDKSKMIINYAVAHDLTNQRPLLYEYYPGCINDVSQLQSTVEAFKDYGYNNVGFLLDRGYFSRDNIKYMDDNGYPFIIMVKGMKALVHDLVTKVRGTFESDPDNLIVKHDVYGTTCVCPLCAENTIPRYFHIFFDPYKAANEQHKLSKTLNSNEEMMRKKIGKKYTPSKEVLQYFDLQFDSNNRFQAFYRKKQLIRDIIEHAGYFVIITSERMTAQQAITIYKSRDINEKLFRADKSFLGNQSERTHSSASTSTKIFTGFIALIVRNEMYVSLRKKAEELGSNPEYLTVCGAIDILEEMKIRRTSKYKYRLAHAISKKQKIICSAFQLTPALVKKRVEEIGEILRLSASKDPNTEIYSGNRS